MKLSRVFLVSAGLHGAVILILLFYTGIQGCFKEEKPEVITWVSIASPVEERKPIPEQKTLQPKPEPKQEVRPKSPTLPPKPKLKKASEIKKGKKIRKSIPKKTNPKPVRPAYNPPTKDFVNKKLLNTLTPREKTENDFQFLYDLVDAKIRPEWNQQGLSAGLKAILSIRINKEGRIIQRKLLTSSGDQHCDATIMAAARSVDFIAKLPRDYKEPYKDLSIEFVVD